MIVNIFIMAALCLCIVAIGLAVGNLIGDYIYKHNFEKILKEIEDERNRRT